MALQGRHVTPSMRSRHPSRFHQRARPRLHLRYRRSLPPRRLHASAPDTPVRPFRADSAHLKGWTPDGWRHLEAKQQPEYPDAKELRDVIDVLSTYPPLVFAGECRMLQMRLAKAASGDAFVLQGGDCAEAFSQFNANRIRDSYRYLQAAQLRKGNKERIAEFCCKWDWF